MARKAGGTARRSSAGSKRRSKSKKARSSGSWRHIPWPPDQWSVTVTGLLVLGATLLLVGSIASLALAGAPRLDRVAIATRQLLGWASLPVALGFAATGAALVLRRDESPWRLPWGRAVGVELAVLAALVLLTGAFGSPPGTEGQSAVLPGGLVGWALARASAEAIGPFAAAGMWLLAGLVGLLAASDVGGRRIAVGLDRAASWLADGGGGRGFADDGALRGASATQPPSSASAEPASTTESSSGAAPDPAPEATSGAAAAAATGTATTRDGGAQTAGRVRSGTKTRRGAPGPTPGRKAAAAGGAIVGIGAANLPSLDILGDDLPEELSDATLEAMGKTIERSLASFGVPVDVVEIERGPSVTRFCVSPGVLETGRGKRRVKVSRITSLKHDLALALSAPAIRIEAPIPGRNLVGIEVPSPKLGQVGLKALLADPAFEKVSRARGLAVALGRDVTGAPVVGDLSAMPHLLVAGATGSGKSVCVDSLLASLLFQNTPDTLKLVLVDPKRVELSRYGKLPHLVSAVVTDVEEVVGSLRWIVAEMDRRYKSFAQAGVRDLAGHNARSPAGEAPIPVLAVVIDELADLMLTAPTETEPLLTRIAQLGRATGIHLVVATQRPSTDVVTGLIKANFPSRIAFAVASGIDSRVILDQTGAEALLGRGDMLYQAPESPRAVRAQGALVTDDELDRLVAFWRGSHWDAPRRVPPWDDLITPLDKDEALLRAAQDVARANPDDLTPSLLQRKLRVGYGKARELYEQIEDDWPVDAAAEREGGSEADLDWMDDEFERERDDD